MRIVIDMQGAQTESRFRGIGRYTMTFAQAVVRNRGEHEIYLALNGLSPETIEPIRAAFDGLLPQENIRVWSAPGPVKAAYDANDARREAAELIREAFLASLQPDIIHICSLFEGHGDDAVSSIGRLDTDTPVSVTLHDLIPLLNPDLYLTPHPDYARYYLHKLKFLRLAGIYLAVSESSREEGVRELKRSPDLFINTLEAVEPNFQPQTLEEAPARELRDKFGIHSPFVLYTGGGDQRKNLPRLIEAWANLPGSLRRTHQLLFAGRMLEDCVAELRQVARQQGLRHDELVFTGYVSDEELVHLYNLCKLFVFPSWHEGFGLPALEAMACGAPVIGANTTSLPEVIGLDAALFDPLDVVAIRDKIQAALTDEKFLESLRAHGLAQSKRFSWDLTAQKAIAAWEGVVASTTKKQRSLPWAGGYSQKNLLSALTPYLREGEEQGLISLAADLAQNESAGIERQILVDISELCQSDMAAGIQHVSRNYLHQLLLEPPCGFRVQPVYATQTEGYRYARAYTAKFLGQTPPRVDDSPIVWQRGDIFLGLDSQPHAQVAHAGTFAQMRQEGVVVKFLVRGLRLTQSADSTQGDNAKALDEQWLTMVANQDAAICTSEVTADAYEDWLSTHGLKTATGFSTDWLPLETDVAGAQPSSELLRNAELLKNALVGQHYPRRQLLVDVSELTQRDARTGIQRVVRSILTEWMSNPPEGFRVEPVYATMDQPYRYARKFTAKFLNRPRVDLADDPIDFQPGDIFFALDFQPQIQAAKGDFYQHLRQRGVSVKFLVYDLLCILQPQHFPDGAAEDFSRWLEVAAETDGLIGISQSVASDINSWVTGRSWKRLRPLQIHATSLGCDVAASAPSDGLPRNANEVLAHIERRSSFLMVGTLEPRKGHLQVIDAFDELWRSGSDVNLVIVGKKGWMVDRLADRLRAHPELDKRLFWLEGISDEYLEKVYAAGTALIAASYGEGFGLPLIEAAQHKLPVIARDIPVFREVAGDHAFYFEADTPKALQEAISRWLQLNAQSMAPQSINMPWHSWGQAAASLLSIILGKH